MASGVVAKCQELRGKGGNGVGWFLFLASGGAARWSELEEGGRVHGCSGLDDLVFMLPPATDHIFFSMEIGTLLLFGGGPDGVLLIFQ
jgi:hypothetical protein